MRRKRMAGWLLWIFAASMCISLYIGRYNVFQKIDYAPLYHRPSTYMIKGKRVLALRDEWELYLHNTPCTPFINWEVCESIFKNPRYYENQIAVAEGFAADYPEIVIDPHHYFDKFLWQQPALRAHYKREGDNWIFNN